MGGSCEGLIYRHVWVSVIGLDLTKFVSGDPEGHRSGVWYSHRVLRESSRGQQWLNCTHSDYTHHLSVGTVVCFLDIAPPRGGRGLHSAGALTNHETTCAPPMGAHCIERLPPGSVLHSDKSFQLFCPKGL